MMYPACDQWRIWSMAAGESVVRSEPWDVDRRLTELGNGLTRALLTEVISRATAAHMACTPHHPRNFAPIARWGNGIAAMRDQLVPFAWASADRDGQPLIVNPDGELAITISGADKQTGRDGDVQPRTSAKGAVTVEAVEQNGYLFSDMEADAMEKARVEARFVKNTWFLLMHFDRVTGQVRSELSHPTKTDEERRIVGWSERILLEPFEFDPTALAVIGDEGPDDGDVTIEIKRRS
jgi:transcription antitermination factor NusG